MEYPEKKESLIMPETQLKQKIFFDDHPLVIPVETAQIFGLNEAIVLQQLHYWIRTKGKQIDDEFWIYNSYEKWQENFPFWSVKTVRRILKKLESEKLVKINNFNKMKQDNTNWYTINYFECQKRLSLAQTGRPPGQVDHIHKDRLTRPPGQVDQTVNHEINSHENNQDIYKEEISKKEFRSSKPNENSHNFGVSSWQYQISSDFYESKPDLQEFEFMCDEKNCNFKNWCATLNHLNTKFKKTPEKIIEVIAFAGTNEFWKDVFTNISDLTHKRNGKTVFEKIELAMIKDYADLKQKEIDEPKPAYLTNYL